MTIHIDLSDIPEIKELPKIERNESRGGFVYPEEFIGNIYRHNNKLIFFGEKTMEEASIGMINLLVSIISKSADDNNEQVQQLSNLEDAITQVQVDVSQSIEELSNNLHKLTSKIDNPPEQEKYDDRVIRQEISNIINKLDQIQTDSELSSLEIAKQIDQLKNRTDLDSLIDSKVDDKLTDVHKNFKAVTAALVKEEVIRLENELRLKSNKLTASQIAMFKEMGLSVENIIELKKNNML